MTLLVGGISGDSTWMMADTSITGGTIQLRERENQIKIVPSTDGRALIGFAGDQHHGACLMEQARLQPAGTLTAQALLKGHLEYPSVDFAYGYRDEQGPHLVRISGGAARHVLTLHIGSSAAFEKFQAIKLRVKADPVPASVSILFCGNRGTEAAPEELRASLSAMLRLFAEWPERDVGGIAIPYFLTKEGAFLCGYGYSVTDPLIPQLHVGSALPHGTAQAGGFGLSLTEWCKNRGLVVYWLQKPGGTVFVRTEGGYSALDLPGTPAEFKNAAQSALGEPVDILFGESDPQGAPDRITIVRDRDGKQSIAVAKHGNSLSFSVLNVETEFWANTFLEPQRGQLMKDTNTAPARVTVAEGGNTLRVELLAEGEPVGQVELNAAGVDALIAMLGSARASMKEQLAAEPNLPPATSEVVVIDPAWRTAFPPHPSLQGLMLRLRHLHFGWVSFLLPHNEAAARKVAFKKRTSSIVRRRAIPIVQRAAKSMRP
jgi:hypothetical protein